MARHALPTFPSRPALRRTSHSQAADAQAVRALRHRSAAPSNNSGRPQPLRAFSVLPGSLQDLQAPHAIPAPPKAPRETSLRLPELGPHENTIAPDARSSPCLSDRAQGRLRRHSLHFYDRSISRRPAPAAFSAGFASATIPPLAAAEQVTRRVHH